MQSLAGPDRLKRPWLISALVLLGGQGLAGCSLLPVTKAAALPAPERAQPGPGERRIYNKAGQLVGIEEYMVDEAGRTWRHGKEWQYWPDGQLKAEREFDHDEPSGRWQSFWQDGSIRSDYRVDSDELTPMVYRHPDGGLASKGQALHGRREGDWTYWYSTGVVASRGAYWQGKKHGEWSSFHPDGSWESHGSYDSGDKISPWEYWEPGRRERAPEYAPK